MDDRELPFSEHLTELRSRLLVCVGTVLAFTVGTYAFKQRLFDLLTRPMQAAFKIAHQINPEVPERAFKMAFKDPIEPFFTYLKVAVLAAVFLSVPVLLYQAWMFIAPGLYRHERKATAPFIVVSTAMFIGGAAFCYATVLPYGYGYLLTYAGEVYVPTLMMREYLSLTAKLLIAFGLVFEVPVFIIFLARLGMVTPDGLVRYRKYAWVLVFVVAAVMTPPDVITQLFLAAPLVLLYEVSIYGARLFGRPSRWASAADEESDDAEV